MLVKVLDRLIGARDLVVELLVDVNEVLGEPTQPLRKDFLLWELRLLGQLKFGESKRERAHFLLESFVSFDSL